MISSITFTPSGGSPLTLHAVTTGATAVVTRAEGLQGAPALREVKALKGQQHGAYIRSKWLDARAITLEGEIIGADLETSFDLYDALAKAFMASVSTAGVLKWTRSSAGQALQVDCQVAALSPLTMADGGNMIQYQVTFACGDPRVFDQSETTNTGTTITVPATGGTTAYNNTGSIATPPKIRIYGGITNAFVRLSTGAGLTFTNVIAGADYLEIDVKNRTVKTNGTTSLLSALNAAASDWFEIPTGTGTMTTTCSAVSGSPRVDLIYRSAWI